MKKANLLNSVKMTAPKHNTFDLSHDFKFTCNMGELVPVLNAEVVPGDRFNIGADSLIRLAPLVSPMMHRCDMFIHYFFVPYRLLWENFENYASNGGVSGVFPAFPYVLMDVFNSNTYRLSNYLGIPKGTNPDQISQLAISAMSFAAYQFIYNEYYRDQNLQSEIPYKLVDGDNGAIYGDLLSLRRRAWQHDYFTSNLPFAQKGPDVVMPTNFIDVPVRVQTTDPGDSQFNDTVSGGDRFAENQISTTTSQSQLDPNELYAETSRMANVAPNINDLRLAIHVQEWYEKLARGGTRFVEILRSFFGVTPQDARFQRPEYITGTRAPIIISEVLQTSESATTPQANMAGHGVSVNQGNNGYFDVPEHGIIMGIMSVMPEPSYMQGIPRQFLKINSPTELYWPQFANLGEQATYNAEIYAFTPQQFDEFGYLPRYTEFKHMPSRTAGEFQTSLDFWTMARKFANAPALNAQFIECDPTHRVFAVTNPTVDKLYCQVYHKIRAKRPMPFYGTPTF